MSTGFGCNGVPRLIRRNTYPEARPMHPKVMWIVEPAIRSAIWMQNISIHHNKYENHTMLIIVYSMQAPVPASRSQGNRVQDPHSALPLPAVPASMTLTLCPTNVVSFFATSAAMKSAQSSKVVP